MRKTTELIEALTENRMICFTGYFSLFLICIFALSSCGHGDKSYADIFIITVDGMKDGIPEEFLDGNLQDGGTSLQNAYTTVPATLPSYASLLTGLIPPMHCVRDNGSFSLDENISTIPELLKRNGYFTSAFVSSFLLNSEFGLSKGFDVYKSPGLFEDEKAELFSSPSKIRDLACKWFDSVEDSNNPVMQWIQFQGIEGKDEYSSSSVLKELENCINHISSADRTRRSVFLILSHKPRMFELDPANHLFSNVSENELKLSAFIVSGNSSRDIDSSSVSICNLASRILKIAGLKIDFPGADTQSPVYFENLRECLYFGWPPVYGVIENGSIYQMQGNRIDASVTPNAQSFLSSLDITVDSSSSRYYLKTDPKKRAERMGYHWPISSTKMTRTPEFPKDFRTRENLLIECMNIEEGSDTYSSIDIAESVLLGDPYNRYALLQAGKLFMNAGDYVMSENYLRKSLSTYPYDLENHVLMTSLYVSTGRHDDARSLMVNACSKLPGSDEVHYLAGYLSYVSGRIDDALKYLTVSNRLNPHFNRTAFLLAKCYTDKGDMGKASEYLKRAIELDVPGRILEEDPYYDTWVKRGIID